MNEFEPSLDFVARVMAGVQAIEAEKRQQAERFERLWAWLPLRAAASAGGTLFALDTAWRVAFLLLDPVVCR